MTLTTLAAPAGGPVPLADARDFLRVGHGGEDGLVSSLLAAAVARVEAETGLALITRTLRLTLPDWPRLFETRGLRLRPAPVASLIEARVNGGEDGPEDVTARLRLVAGLLCPRRWAHLPPVPDDGAIEVDFTAGFGGPDAAPEDLKLAVKLVLAAAYAARDGRVFDLPEEAARIIGTYREARI